jgi:hypothetical protein
MAKAKNAEYRSVSKGEDCIWSDKKHHLWFPLSFTKYRVENGRLYVSKGLLSSREDECLLYRITDITMTRSLAQKMFGTGTIQLNTKDRTTPIIFLENIKRPADVKRMLSNLIEEEREKHSVVGKEMYGAISHMDPVDFEEMDDFHN